MKRLTTKLLKKCTKIGILFLLYLYVSSLFSSSLSHIRYPGFNVSDERDLMYKLHYLTVENFYRKRQLWPNSKLGAILFKLDKIPQPNRNENRTYSILIWKHWQWLKNRHVYNFGPTSDEKNMLESCSVKNCVFSGDSNLMNTADAVVIHLLKGDMPAVKNRNPKQRWIFLTDESPKHTFYMARKKWSMEELNNIFNWSMTYRNDADVPVPYGRTVPLDKPFITSRFQNLSKLVPNWETKIRDVPATLLMSNCGNKERNIFLKQLMRHLKVDVYGKCSNNKKNKNRCPGHFKADCDVTSKYLFYLVLENSNCFQYLTEKVFYNAYTKGAIPVIWGPLLEDVETLLPPNSYLYVDEHTNLKLLVHYILTMTKNDELLLSMHKWRTDFKIVNEHGYFGTKSFHLCRLCEAMNYNDEREKIYGADDLKWFLDPSLTCKKY